MVTNLSQIILSDPSSDNIFEQLPHFVTSDPRTSRFREFGFQYNINKTFLQKRYDSFFHGYDLQDKRVLDLGCCVGAVGAYVLSKGAKYYVGVEYSKGLSNIATINLSDSFDAERWCIKNDSIENFIKNLSENFDIVVASGIWYAMFDAIPILLALYEKTNSIIVESMHPNLLDQYSEEIREKFQKSDFWKQFQEKGSFIQYKKSNDYITKTEINGSYPSIGFFKHYLNLLGFKDTNVYDLLKTELPETYFATGRFGERFEKYKDTKEALGYVEI